jgi:RNA polymerase sigma factor (sigma-70 family)
VARLPRRQRAALVLRYFADLPVADVADLMGCSQGTVKALTHQAIAALRARGGLVELEEAADA